MKKIHVLFGPDGNRRYALEKEISYEDSYQLLVKKCVNFVDWSLNNSHIGEISIWLLQEHNLLRGEDEIRPLIELVENFILQLCIFIEKTNVVVDIRLIGNLDVFFQNKHAHKENILERLNKVNTEGALIINIFIAYNAGSELFTSVENLKEQDKKDMRVLSTCGSYAPIDLFIRTGQPSGFCKVSGYWVGFDTCRFIGLEKSPEDLHKADFEIIINSYLNLQDSASRVLANRK